MEQILERMERQLENIGTEQVKMRDEQAKMREDIAWIKGKLEGRIDTRTTIIQDSKLSQNHAKSYLDD